MQKSGLLREGDSLYDPASIRLMHHLNAALRAHAMYHKDVEYIVRNGEVIIVDEFTGRTMPGRRWSDGLHQAVEAKEGVRIREENQTIASITFQNYFRLYQKLAGMTGTADTEAFEFQQIYGLEVVVVPTHRPMVRKDMPDLVYLNQQDKFDAIVEDIRDCAKRGQPVLVGTTSIETSEKLSGHLKEAGIAHAVLNAKQHEREALVIAQAGRPGTVTIATNMAGRGTDIKLGGNFEYRLKQALAEAGLREGDPEHLAEIAVGVREFAGLNPLAMYRDPITVSDVLEYLAGGMTVAELLADFPQLGRPVSSGVLGCCSSQQHHTRLTTASMRAPAK